MGKWIIEQLKRIDAGSINRVIGSRRSAVALTAIWCLTILGIVNKIDTSLSIAAVASAIAAAGGYQSRGKDEPK